MRPMSPMQPERTTVAGITGVGGADGPGPGGLRDVPARTSPRTSRAEHRVARFPVHNPSMTRTAARQVREAWIVDAVRTPVGRYGGALAAVRPDDLAAIAIRAVVERSGIDPALIEDVILGCANQAGEDNRNVARMAALLAGLPGGGRRADGQPAVRLRPPGDQLGRPRDRRRRRRRVHRRRRRVDDPGAVRDGQARGRLRSRRARAAGHDARLAVRQPEAGRRCTTRTRWARPRRTSPSAGRVDRGSARTRSRWSASSGRSRRSRAGGSTARSCR